MWKCQKCGKPVYFAERRQSLGFDWHPYCLKCEECGKVLIPGQHAEHAGGPYCHIPCYAALFGPKLFGHGSTTESHRSFGRRENSFVREEDDGIRKKLKEFNQHYKDRPRSQVSSREVNGRLVLEGVLTIYWGTETTVRLAETADNRVIARQRKTQSLYLDTRVSQFEEEPISALTPLLDRPPSPPFFDPSTHPLGEEERDTPDELFNELDDLVDTEGFLSLDPLHKWETLSSLCTSPPKGLHPQLGSKSPPTESPQPASPELNPRADTLKRSHSDRLGNSFDSSPLPTFDSSSKTLPSSLSSIRDDLDDLLCVERKLSEHERVNHTVTGGLPLDEKSEKKSEEEVIAKSGVAQKVDELMENNLAPIQAGEGNEEVQGCAEKVADIKTEETGVEIGKATEVKVKEARGGKRFLVEKCEEQTNNSTKEQKGVGGPIFQLGEYRARPRPKMQEDKGGGKGEPMSLQEEDVKASGGKSRERKGARALRRRPAGRRVTRQQRLARRSSINGHWYDRETCVFTPPKHSAMSVYTSSLANHADVLTALLAKYKVEAEPGEFALYLMHETGERRIISETEFPLLLRVRTGPHEDVAKLYLMDRTRTEEISQQVAAFLRFSYAELRSFLNMFYEEEEREADRIRTKFLLIKRRLQRQLEALDRKAATTEEEEEASIRKEGESLC